MATDLQMLRALLTLPPVQLKERRPFQAMYDDLVNGKVVQLSRKQRAWVEERFLHHKLDRKELPPKTPPPRVRDKRKPDGLLDFGPLPKKPPGRKSS